MKRYIVFLILVLASFVTLLLLGSYQHYVAGLLEEVFWLGEKTMPMLYWIPYTFIAVSGIFLGGAFFVKGKDKKEERVLAVMSLILAIAAALFTILVMKMIIRVGVTAVNWSDGGAKPSMVIAGALLANALRHFMEAKKYDE